ncbi:MAG: hypothetical protein KAI29_02970, partial [Cyclobacteriaceae bacterium]|nr:hypothetical protein [Cyclobacteriaceae bacterium]
GGFGGFSVPSGSDNAVFNANGTGNCNVDITVDLDRFGVNGYTGTIDLAGYNVTVAASSSGPVFSSGTINDSGGTGQLSITTTGVIIFSGTTFGVQVTMSAGDFNFGPSTFNATSLFTKTGSTAQVAAGGCTFNGTTTFTNSGTGALYLSAFDSDIFNDDVTFNSSSGIVYVATGDHGATFNGNVYVESSSTNIEIGDPAGAGSTLASGKVIAVGGGGFTSGELKLANFTQLGTTAQVITTGGTDTRVYINKGCTWNGNITVTAPHFFVNESTFEGSVSLTKSNNATNSYSDGGNTFNGPTYIENANCNGNLALDGLNPNKYSDVVTFKTSGSGTGILYASAGSGTEINGNLSIDSPSGLVQFFPGLLVIMKGTAAQSINIVGGTPDPIINNLEINNSTGNVTLNTPVTIGAGLVLTQGNIITTSINLLTLNDDVSVTGASDASFVQGPV